MRTLTSILLLIFITLSPLNAQENNGTWLWEISGNGLKSNSYLFGTYHPVGNSIFDSFLKAKKKLLKSEFVLIERKSKNIDSSKITIPNITQKDVNDGFVLWDKLLTKEEKEVFYTYAKKNNRAVYYALNAEEILLELRTIYNLDFCINNKTKDDTVFVMDDHIENIALKNNKKVIGLDDSILYNPMPNDNQKNIALTDSSTVKYLINLMKKMTDSSGFKTKCLELENYINGSNPLFLDSIPPRQPYSSDERNTKWLPIIDAYLKQGQCYIAVGNGHLYFKSGLIALLRNKGYKVKPIKMK